MRPSAIATPILGFSLIGLGIWSFGLLPTLLVFALIVLFLTALGEFD
jgi:hypothetical protein